MSRPYRHALFMTASLLLASSFSAAPTLAQFPQSDVAKIEPATADQAARPIRPPGKTRPSSNGPAAVGDSTQQAVLRVAASMAIVLAVFFMVVWFLRRSLPQQSRVLPSDAFEILGTAALSARHSIQLVKVGNKLLVISLAVGGASSLAEIDDKEEVDRLLRLCRSSRRGRRSKAGEASQGNEGSQHLLDGMGIDAQEPSDTMHAR